MARNTSDVLKLTGAVGLPDPTIGSNSGTQGFWGTDLNAYLLTLDNEFALTYAGNPNGIVAANYVGRRCFDTANRKVWIATTTGNAATAVWYDSGKAEAVDVRDFGAIPDAKGIYDIVCTSGSPTATSATANFTAADVGKQIKIYDIANAAYVFRGTISARNSATSITLSGNATASCSSGNGYGYYGTNNATAINNALTAAAAMVQSTINGPNFPHGTGQIRVTFPIDYRGSGYLFNSTLTPGRNVVIDADAMLFNNCGNGAADRAWALTGTGWHIKKLVIAHNGGMGIDMGTLAENSSTVIEDLQQWTVGVNYDGGATPNAHVALRMTGYDFTIVKNWSKGGNIAFHMDQVSDVFCAMPMELIGASVSVQATSVENATVNWVTDTGSFLAAAIDGSRNSRYYGRAFSVVATALTYGIQIGEYDAGNKCRGLLVDYIGQRTGGVGSKISNCEDSILRQILTNAALFSASGQNITGGITYGSGNNECLIVEQTRDGAISTVSSGTVAGILKDQSDGAETLYGPQAAGLKKIVLTLTNDGTFSVPANHYISEIFINNTTANAVTGGVKIGTTSGATDVLAAFAVGANAKLYVPTANLLKKWFSTSAAQTCFFQDVTSWNSANLTVTIILGVL